MSGTTPSETGTTPIPDQPPPTVPVPAPEPVSWRALLRGALVAGLVGLWLAMNEISLLSGGFLARDDNSSFSFNGMAGPAVGADLGAWHGVLTSDQLSDWRQLLAFYLVLDFVFIALYSFGLWRLLRPFFRIWLIAAAVAVFDLLENLGTIWLAVERCGDADCVPRGLPYVVAVFTGLKWLAVVALFLAGVYFLLAGTNPDRPPGSPSPLKRVRRAVWIQRFSLLAFLPIALLSVVPGSSVFDQMPDVQRRWLGEGGVWWHSLVAGGIYWLVLLPAIFVLGRIRGDWALRRVRGGGAWPFFDADGVARRQNPWFWALGPLVVLGAAGVIVASDRGTVFWPRLVVFCGIPVVVVLLSRLVVKVTTPEPRALSPVDNAFPRDVMVVGDVLAIAAMSLAGLGMIRAFTGLAALEAVGLLNASYVVIPVVALLIGVVLAILPWFAAKPVLDALASWEQSGGQDPDPAPQAKLGRLVTPGIDIAGDDAVNAPPRRTLRLILLIVSIVGFLILAIWPQPVADRLGVLAATILAMTALVIMVGVVVVYAQERQPPEVFQWGPRWLRRRATPIIGLLLASLVVTGLVGGKTDIHPVQAAGVVPARPSMEQAFDAWLAQKDGCSLPVDGAEGLSLRPMLMVAAEGGGIRATYWTASALQKISAVGGGCGRRAALFSAGASGGALGLTIARFTDQPLAAVESIAGHEALGAATIALLSGDLLATATGLRFNAPAPEREPTTQPLDRSELMEVSWERTLDRLRTPFLPDSLDAATSGNGAMTGQLILTSTAVRDGCDALVSQIDLSEGARSTSTPVCGAGVAGAHNYDLFGAYGRTADDDADDCVGNFPALTAGLLASRFPYVTPSGVVEGCRGLKEAQLVDGGYTDNTGLGTIVDLQDSWRKLVQDHNAGVVAAGTGQLVVPLVVYVENGTGPDFSTGKDAPAGLDPRLIPGQEGDHKIGWTQIPESLVPPVTKLWTAKHNQAKSVPLLARAREAVATDQLCGTSERCKELLGDPRVQDRVFVIHQSAQPALSAPLGWVLSASSQQDLTDDMELQASTACSPDCNGGYATLQNLLATLAPIEIP